MRPTVGQAGGAEQQERQRASGSYVVTRAALGSLTSNGMPSSSAAPPTHSVGGAIARSTDWTTRTGFMSAGIVDQRPAGSLPTSTVPRVLRAIGVEPPGGGR